MTNRYDPRDGIRQHQEPQKDGEGLAAWDAVEAAKRDPDPPVAALPLAAKSPPSEFWIDRTASAAGDSASWLLTARKLRQAARVIYAAIKADEADLQGHRSGLWSFALNSNPWPNIALYSVYFLLAGLSTENLAKGLIVQASPAMIQHDRLAPEWPGRGHDLVALFRRAGLALSWEEVRLLLGLRAYVEWGGRYPVPKRFRSAVPRHRVDKGLLWPDAFSATREPLVFEHLFARVATTLGFPEPIPSLGRFRRP